MPTVLFGGCSSTSPDLDANRGHTDDTRGYHYHVASPGTNQFVAGFRGEYGCALEGDGAGLTCDATQTQGGPPGGGPPGGGPPGRTSAGVQAASVQAASVQSASVQAASAQADHAHAFPGPHDHH